MNTAHKPLDIDMAALKKGEVDLGTSMYLSYLLYFLTFAAWPSNSKME
jgi:hypothetical protein